MDDLVRWLRAQLDEDERTARRAGDSFRQIGKTGVIVATEGDRAEECASANWAGIAEHIVAHDPARVLREIDAKRQIVDRYATAINDRAVLRTRMRKVADTDPDEFSRLYREESKLIENVEHLTPVVRLLALPYADRPGYRDEWRP